MTTSTRGAVRWRWIIGIGGAGLALAFLSSRVCLSTGFSKGLWLDACPDGELRQTIHVSAPGLTRGARAAVTIEALATYTTGPMDVRRSSALTAFTPALSLVGPTGEVRLDVKEPFKRDGSALRGELELPKVADGDYLLRTRVTSSLGESTLDLPLPLYTPARIHVLTDRPLYEPGNTVKFRAVALKASDLSPLDGRPGRWLVKDPAGEILLEEKAPAGSMGVVAGSFPLDKGAVSGAWSVTWWSGGTEQTRSFTVKPFTLPRFHLEANAARPFYRKHEKPRLEGSVRYASGAPVANARLELTWSVAGEWPPPAGWSDGTALPKVATTNPSGAFSVDLPSVPEDLQKQAHLNAVIAAVDSSGDRVEGSASILLSADAIAVSAVSELEGGLVQGFNNRLYLRGTTADGRLLEGVTLNVKRLWEPTDKGTDAKVDEDGVASLQLDPGPAVNVVIPAQPFRPPPKEKAVRRGDLQDQLSVDGELGLADRLSFDRVEARLESCARYIQSSGQGETVGVMVHASGAVAGTSSTAGRLGRCVTEALGALRFEASRERLFSATWNFNDNELPKLAAELESVPGAGEELEAAFQDAMFDLRDCLPATVSSGALPKMVSWTLDLKKREAALTWLPVSGAVQLGEGAMACIQGRLTKVTLPKRPANTEPDSDSETPGQQRVVGIARFTISAPAKYESTRPQPTIMTGYEFLVTAKAGSEVLGSTRLLMQPGEVPQIRLRVNSQLVEPGEAVKVDLLRGPDFTGELPEKLFLTHGYQSVEAKVDDKTRSATFTIPGDFEGWAGVQWSGAQVFLFVKPKGQLSVKVTPEKPRYAPGQVAQLAIETTVAGVGGPAAVGLFGVDQSLSQLAPLPGADELSGLRPQVVGAAAFGGLDAQALSLGRVRGRNAAAATLLKVSALPPPPETERAIAIDGATVFDPNEPLVDRFYVVLGELHVQAREWEKSAPAAEKMSPRTMARLWEAALGAVERRKESARDAWGRLLRLHRLPADLLALTDPRQVVVEGTRLPEDVENWSAWVAKEQP